MMSLLKVSFVALSLASLAACTTTLNEQDRALITSASENALAAKQQAAQALQAAQAAQASATAAQASAAAAATDAKAANEKADRIFQRSLRK